MRKREREITLLYGLSLIRDDVLNHPLPKVTAKDRALMAAHLIMRLSLIAALAIPIELLILSLTSLTG